jgi:glycosyltransferase involved in cell wall biosynthesis
MPMAAAGTEIYTHTLATMQQAGGYEVAVVTPHIEYYRPGEINEHYLFENIEVYQFLEMADPTDRQIHYGIKKPEGLENFRQLIIKLKPDIIHFHELNRSIGFTTAHVKIAKQSCAKVFLTIHLSSYTCNTNVLVRNGQLCDGVIREKTCSICSYKTLFHVPGLFAGPLASIGILSQKLGVTGKMLSGKAKTLLRVPSMIERIKKDLMELSENVDQFISYAKWYERILRENGVPQNKISVVAAALVTSGNTERVKKISNENTLPVKIVFIGRIQEQKGIHLMIEAVKHFSEKQVLFDLWGREEATPYYNKCVDLSIDSKNIQWKGSIDRNAVLEMLSKYDILCLASMFSEMSPLVIQEAFAAGIPVLASRVYGNTEQVRDNYNGMLFDFNSVENLQEKIKTLVDNPGIITAMKKNIAMPPDFELVYKSYMEIYNVPGSLTTNNK